MSASQDHDHRGDDPPRRWVGIDTWLHRTGRDAARQLWHRPDRYDTGPGRTRGHRARI